MAQRRTAVAVVFVGVGASAFGAGIGVLGMVPKSASNGVALLVAAGVAVGALAAKMLETAAGERIKLQIAGKAQLGSLLRGQVATNQRGELPRVDQADAISLGVHKAAAHGSADTGLPPFIRRDLDSQLDDALRTGGLILLEGRSAAGKSRAAFEAIRRVCSGRRLLHPRDAAALTDAVIAEVQLFNTLVWLDDLEHYLRVGGVDGPLIDKLHAAGAIVVATLRSEERSALDLADRRAPGAPELTTIRAAREVFNRATVVSVPHSFTSGELDRARQYRHDERIAYAIDHAPGGNIPEHLAAGPAALNLLNAGRSTANPEHPGMVGAALVDSAIDCRRAGHVTPIPVAILRNVHLYYLDERFHHRTDRASFSDAMAWATRPTAGATSPLTPKSDDTFEPFDYLVDHVQRQLPVRLVPDAVWDILATHREVKPLNLYSIGTVAYSLGRLDRAEMIFRRAAQDYNDPRAMGSLTYMLKFLSREDEAEVWARRAAAEHSDPLSMTMLSMLLAERGEVDEAKTWARRAATEHNYVIAMGSLSMLLLECDEVEEAEAWARRAATEHNHCDSMVRIMGLLMERGEVEEAEAWARRAATEHNHPLAMGSLSELLAGRGEVEEAEVWARRAATEHNHPLAMDTLSSVLTLRGELKEAEVWARRASVEHDLPLAMGTLTVLLAARGEVEEAEAWARRAASEHNDPQAMSNLSSLLAARGEVEEADVWARRAASGHNQNPIIGLLADLLAARVQTEEDEA